MVVISLMGIIAAIAIPNLMHTRILANEAAAVTRLKSYATAQETFQRGRNGRRTVNTNAGSAGYCDNYRNLYYGVPIDGTAGKDLLQLITKEHADAYGYGKNEQLANATNPVAATVGNPTVKGADGVNGVGIPFQGYHFFTPGGLPGPNSKPTVSTTSNGVTTEIRYGRREGWFTTLYAQLAAPALSGSTGRHAYYLGIDGRVWMRSLEPEKDIVATRKDIGTRQYNPAGMYGEFNEKYGAFVDAAQATWLPY